MRPLVTIIWASVFSIGGALAQQGVRWQASSTTAISITGNITLQETRVTFANGKSLQLERIEARSGRWSPMGGASEDGTIYKVNPPADPVLRNRNTFCGSPVTHIVLTYPSRSELTMYVYALSAPPKGNGTDELCASYYYAALPR